MNQYLRRKIWTLNRSGKFRGYLRTVSGYPVTLTDCMAGQPVSLAVDGNAVQDGTPTPDNPIDVQLCGDRTVNLLDVRAFEDTTHDSSLSIQLTPNTIYTFGYNTVVSVVYVYAINESGEGAQLSRTEIGNHIINFQTEATGKIRIRLTKPSKRETLLSTWMLIEGAYTAETMPAYEPYGYKVPLTMTGINLLSNNENDWVSDAGIYKHFKIPVEGTTTLQLKLKEGKSIPEKLYLGYSKNGMDATGGVSWLIAEGRFNYGPIHANSSKYISIHPKTALLDEIFDSLDIMLIEGAYTAETMPAYEPYREPQTFNIYTPQQLAKVGDIADTVVLDFDNKKATLTNNIGDFVLTNMQAAQTSYSNDNYSSYYVVNYNFNTMGMKKNTSIVCDKLPFRRNSQGDLNGNSIGFGGNTSLLYVCISKLIASDAASVSGILEGSKCYMPLLNPITTDITALQDWDAIPSLWSGTTEITADTVIAPNAITAKYYASKPEEVN